LKKSIAVFVLSIGILCILLYLITHPPTPKIEPIPEGSFSEWMGIYFHGQKVGYLASYREHTDTGTVYISKTYMEAEPMGKKDTVEVYTKGLADNKGNFQSVEMIMKSGAHFFRLTAHREDTTIYVKVESGGTEKTATIPCPREAFIPVTVEALALNAPGKIQKFKLFDPLVGNIIDVEVIPGEKESLDIHSEKYYARRVDIKMLNTYTSFWIDDENRIVKEHSPIGVDMLIEPEEMAKRIEGKVKLYDMFAVKVGRVEIDPRTAQFLKIRISGIDTKDYPINDSWQTLRGNTLTIKKPALPPDTLRIHCPDSLAKDTLPTPFLPSNDSTVLAFLKTIVETQEPTVKNVERINLWLFKNLTKKPTFSFPNPLDVLKTKEGDCNEHSILFATFCRSLGIPAKVIVGLVYVEGGFYYHAWNKVWLGKWIPVDPTFGQFPADPFHMKLEEGDFSNQARIMGVIGSINIEILEYK